MASCQPIEKDMIALPKAVYIFRLPDALEVPSAYGYIF